jgi:hypothetical protein
MKRIHDHMPFFFQDKEADKRFNIPSEAMASLNLNRFFLNWANTPSDTSKELEDKFNLTDSVDIDLKKQNNNSLLDEELFYKSPYCKYNYRNSDGYHILDTIPPDEINESHKNKEVLYKYNSEWFRCDNFKKNHDGLHILFSGCSNTEGVGANIEDTWSHMLYTELSKKYKIDGYYNLAKSGSGWQIIAQNFMLYVDKFGAPDYFFILHPDLLRYYVWRDNNSGWNWTSNGADHKYLFKEHKEQFTNWVIGFRIFLKYCESIGTKVLWSTWYFQETDNIIRTSLFSDTFFPIDRISNQSIKDNNYYSLMDRDDAGNARDGHDGYIQQYHWFNMFKEEIEKRKIIKTDFLNEV